MISRRTEAFKKLLAALPADIRKQAKIAYKLWGSNPSHPGLRFKKIHGKENIWSVRINENYRAVGVRKRDEIVWFWIGNHSDYDQLLH